MKHLIRLCSRFGCLVLLSACASKDAVQEDSVIPIQYAPFNDQLKELANKSDSLSRKYKTDFEKYWYGQPISRYVQQPKEGQDSDESEVDWVSIVATDGMSAFVAGNYLSHITTSPYVLVPFMIVAGALNSYSDYLDQTGDTGKGNDGSNDDETDSTDETNDNTGQGNDGSQVFMWNGNHYALDLTHPMNSVTDLSHSQYNGLMDSSGLYHNYLISQVVLHSKEKVISPSDFLKQGLDLLQPQIDDKNKEEFLCAFDSMINYDQTNIIDYSKPFQNTQNCNPYVVTALKTYYYTLETLPNEVGIVYTNDFLKLSKQILNKIDYDILSCSVSIFYYSHLFWNRSVPNAYAQDIYLLYDETKNIWYLSCTDGINSYLKSSLGKSKIVVGVPKIVNGKIISLFFYTNDPLTIPMTLKITEQTPLTIAPSIQKVLWNSYGEFKVHHIADCKDILFFSFE